MRRSFRQIQITIQISTHNVINLNELLAAADSSSLTAANGSELMRESIEFS